MPVEMQGRRLSIVNYGTEPAPMVGQLPEFTQAGDYCGPIIGYTGDVPAVFYLLPNARDADVHGPGRVRRHVCSPPHVFIEEPDGTLTIRESIGAMPHWHGFLTEGRWELSKSKP